MHGIRASFLGCALLLGGGATAAAAQGSREPVTVRTFMLQRLSQQQAADLLAPYTSQGRGEGVFTAGTGVHGVTVRGTRETLERVDSLLRANDRQARLVRLRFQLITTSDSAIAADPAISDVETALRGLFRYRGYRLKSQGVITVTEGAPRFSLGIDGQDERFTVVGTVRNIGAGSDSDAVQLEVRLQRPSDAVGVDLLATELTAEFGKTVVLGSTVAPLRGETVILTIRPERP